MEKNIIEIKDLDFSYGDNKVFNKLNLNIKQGTYNVILGRNGSGKSTLARILLGLLEHEGEIKIDNIILNSDNVYNIREKIGIVFQNPDNQFIGSTVKDDIAFGLENHCVEHDLMENIILEFSKKVGMEEFLEKEPSHLSGGQKQRVAIAGVLAMNPSILIFDEATSMLDPKGKREIKELIYKTKKENSNLTILSITHDVEETNFADNIIILNNGKVYKTGTPDEIFNNYEDLLKIGLDVPFYDQLILSLKKKGLNFNCRNKKDLVNELCK